uniref:Uncharacterized protein n=1 Tax=Rhizophora mucronata TaxID=61149 RepID=A0A2P2PA56_RHIMU
METSDYKWSVCRYQYNCLLYGSSLDHKLRQFLVRKA